MYNIILAIALERFCIVTDTFAESFSIKTSFYEHKNIFLSRIRLNYTKLLTASERTLKIKLMFRWTFLLVLIMSGGMAKQKHENHIVE